jgi:hypothetical protein
MPDSLVWCCYGGITRRKNFDIRILEDIIGDILYKQLVELYKTTPDLGAKYLEVLDLRYKI